MKDPQRLIEGSSNPLSTELLSAGMSEEPSPMALHRTLHVVAASTVVAAATASAAATTLPAATAALEQGGSVLASQGAAAATAVGGASGVHTLTVGAAGSVKVLAAAGASKVAIGSGAGSLLAGPATSMGVGALAQWVGIGFVAAAAAGLPSAALYLESAESATMVPHVAAKGASETAALKETAPDPFSRAAGTVAHTAPALSAAVPSQREPLRAASSKSVTTGQSKRPTKGSSIPPQSQGQGSAALTRTTAAPSANATETRAQKRLMEETRLIDEARAARRTGNDRRALALLANYETRFPDGQLAPEVFMVRMEARSRLGDQASARTNAIRILNSDPDGPHSTRAREVLKQDP